MDVVADRGEVIVAAAVHNERLVASAEEVAEEFMTAIEASGVGAEEPAHASDEIAVGCLDDEVKMIAHQAIGVDLPVGLGTSFTEGGEEAMTIGVVGEDGLAAVAPAHQMINRAGIFDP